MVVDTAYRPIHALDRLANLHIRLTRLKGSDLHSLKACDFDGQLDEFSNILADLKALEAIHSELSALDSAFDLLLRLFGLSSRDDIDGPGLECLLGPLCKKLKEARSRMEELL